MSKKSDNYDFTTMLEEAQLYYDTQIRSFEVLRDNAKTIISVASVLVSLFATFGTQAEFFSKSIWYALSPIAIAFLYGWMMVKSLVAIAPGFIHHPIKPDDNVYAETFLNKKEKAIIKQRLANYLNVIPKNELIIKERRELGRLITVQLAVIVILILITNIMQLYS